MCSRVVDEERRNAHTLEMWRIKFETSSSDPVALLYFLFLLFENGNRVVSGVTNVEALTGRYISERSDTSSQFFLF